MKRVVFLILILFVSICVMADDTHQKIGEGIENYVLDVILETDIMDIISDEESRCLESMWDETNPVGYYIYLIQLYGKYIKEE